jgi:beta-galactosidase/beta-glucuronidase
MPIHLRLLRLTPVESEIEFTSTDGPAEVRGRLMGPTCAVTTTIEVAYHVRANRVIIPEPAWWDPQSPFLYRGPVELWRDGQKVETGRVQIGLRHTTGAGGHVVHNGRPVELKSKRIETVDEEEMRAARNAGFNAVDVPAGLADQACAIADRIGLFVIPDGPTEIDPLLHPSAITR